VCKALLHDLEQLVAAKADAASRAAAEHGVEKHLLYLHELAVPKATCKKLVLDLKVIWSTHPMTRTAADPDCTWQGVSQPPAGFFLPYPPPRLHAIPLLLQVPYQLHTLVAKAMAQQELGSPVMVAAVAALRLTHDIWPI
jgi:hypothetical protein